MTQTKFSTPIRPQAARFAARHPVAVAIAGVGLALAGAAIWNHRQAKRAEVENAPTGNFVEVNGVRLHYIEQGEGEPLVLLHGNGSMIQDFVSSGLVEKASASYRTIVFDRPGYGHSERPRGTLWTPARQADLIVAALTKIGISRALVLGHSWGAAVAVAMAVYHPSSVKALIVASGYFYPSARADVVALSGPAMPVVGDLIDHTIAPLLSRLMWPGMTRKLFRPEAVPRKFKAFPKEMTFRPSQLHASAEETAMMIPNAFVAQKHYDDLEVPVAIIAGDRDSLIDIDKQSARLHAQLPHSTFYCVQGAGHMVHQTAPACVLAAINQTAAANSEVEAHTRVVRHRDPETSERRACEPFRK